MTPLKSGGWADPNSAPAAVAFERFIGNPGIQLIVLAHLAAIAAFFTNGVMSEGTKSLWNMVAMGALFCSIIVGWRSGRIAKLCVAAVLSNLLARFLFLLDERAERGIYFMGVAVFFVAVAALIGAILGRAAGRPPSPANNPPEATTKPGQASKVQLPEIKIAAKRTLCPGCGQYSYGTTAQCPSCGVAILTTSGSHQASCSKCGAIASGGHKFCSSCGSPVAGGE